MSRTVFYSWQSDRSKRENRNLIENALESAVARIAKDLSVEEAVREGLKLDKDTKGVPGSPPLFATILAKIDRASVFVADLTVCGTRCDGRPTPNPNVLIEYGWALKSLGYFQVLTVMNAAYGDPGAENMPFDLAHLRFPMTYNVPEGASDSVRNAERERLANTFEIALRLIFESEEFKAKLPKQPEPPAFPQKEPLNGRARFRPQKDPVGIARDVIADLVGSSESRFVHLADGPAMWLRVMPLYDSGKTWLSQDLKQPALSLSILPLLQITGNIGFVRGEDGCGYYQIMDNDHTYSISYVFNTGEVWVVNAWPSRVAGYVQLDEPAFVKSLEDCASFLDRLGCERPYQWVAGMEGIRGRRLVLPGNAVRTFGPCVGDLIEENGIFDKDAKAADLLRPFFEKVFDQCGLRRT